MRILNVVYCSRRLSVVNVVNVTGERPCRGRAIALLEVGEVEFLTCLFWGGDGCRVSRGDGRNKSERLERMGSAPSVEFTSRALAAGW